MTLNSSAERHACRTSAAARLRALRPRLERDVGAQVVEPVGVDRRALGARRDDDEVAVPGRELLELRQQLLALGATLNPLDALLRIARRQVEAGRRPPPPRPSHAAPQRDRVEQGTRRVGRVERRVEVAGRAPLRRSPSRRSRTSGSISRRARSSRPARDAGERGRLLFAELRRVLGEPRAHRPLGEPAERDELAARADRLRQRPELVGDQHDRRVERRLLEVLEQRVGRVLVQQVRPEQEVDAAVGLERPQVEVVVELADGVDPDHVAERLDDAQVGVRPLHDAPRVAELRARERERGASSCRPRPGRGRERRARPRRRAPPRAAASPRAARTPRRPSATCKGSMDLLGDLAPAGAVPSTMHVPLGEHAPRARR